MTSKLPALAVATVAILATFAGGIALADDPGSALDAQPADRTDPRPQSDDGSGTNDGATDDGATNGTETPGNESFPQSLETIVYEGGNDTRDVTFVSDDERFSIEPTVVGSAGPGTPVPTTFDFTPMLELTLDGTDVADGTDSDGTETFELPENATGEPVEEFDPDVPVSDPPREVHFDAENGTVTVVTAEGASVLHPTTVTWSDDGTVRYYFDEVATVELVEVNATGNEGSQEVTTTPTG